MKKICLLLLFVLTLSATTKAQTDWVTKNLDEKLSIKFPAEPEKTGTKGVDIYIAKGKDSVVYTATVIDLHVLAGLDSATLASVKDTQEFADQMRGGMLSKMGNYTISEVAMDKWKTYTTYTISGSENTNKTKVYIQMIVIGSKMYSLSCMQPANVATKNNDVFLGSADLVKK